jgi:hypothetical protein
MTSVAANVYHHVMMHASELADSTGGVSVPVKGGRKAPLSGVVFGASASPL